MAHPRTGQCLCGAVKFKATLKALHVDACHCGMCRRQIGGPLMSVNCEPDVKIEGEDNLQFFSSSDWGERAFCKICGSNLFWRMKDGSFLSVNAGAFDDVSDFDFTMEIFIDKKPDFYDFKQNTKKLTEAEVIEMFSSGGETH